MEQKNIPFLSLVRQIKINDQICTRLNSYQNSVKTHTFSSLDVSDTIFEEHLKGLRRKQNDLSKILDKWQNMKKTQWAWIPNKQIHLTVLWGLTLAILRARSMACSWGLQTTGVFGNAEVGLKLAKCPMMSKISELLLLLVVVVAVVILRLSPTNSTSSSSSETVFLWMGFRVSKQIIPSKQSSKPSLLSDLAAWTLSAFVNI